MLTELAVPFTSPIVFYKNQSAVELVHNPIHIRIKYMEIDIFFVQEKVLAKQLLVQNISVLDQWADALTIFLSPICVLFLIQKIKNSVSFSLTFSNSF